MNHAEDRPSLSALERIPHGLMSLTEMVNFNVWSVSMVCAQLMCEVLSLDWALKAVTSGDHEVDEREKERIRKWLGIAADVASEFELQAVKDRIEIFDKKLNKDLNFYDLRYELIALRETIDNGLKFQLVYRYPNNRKELLMAWKEDWASALNSFPSAESDIIAAVDCWALSHSTASVFHAMRTLEHGLRALAKDLGKNFDVQNWQVIINEIEAEIRNLNNALPRGVAKSDRLSFLSQAAKEFVYFKDGWRNHVSHGRGTYDEHQAMTILEHVRSFMNVLASELHE